MFVVDRTALSALTVLAELIVLGEVPLSKPKIFFCHLGVPDGPCKRHLLSTVEMRHLLLVMSVTVVRTVVPFVTWNRRDTQCDVSRTEDSIPSHVRAGSLHGTYDTCLLMSRH